MSRRALAVVRLRQAALAAALVATAVATASTTGCRDVITPGEPLPDDYLREDAGEGAAVDAGAPQDDDDAGPSPDGGAEPEQKDGGFDAPDAGFVDTVDVTDALTIDVAAGIDLPVGRTMRLTATATFPDGGVLDVTESVEWSSLATETALVSNVPGEKGTVRGVAEGFASIRAATPAGDVTGSRTVGIVAPARDALEMDPPASSAPLGAVMQIRAQARLSDGATVDVTEEVVWTSLSPAVATVSNAAGTKGRVTPVTDGVVEITATLDALTESSLVTVLPANVVSVTVVPGTRSAAQGLTAFFTATAALSDGSSRDATADVTWTSLDPTKVIATTVPGAFRGLAIGSASIEARYGVGGPAGTGSMAVTAPVLVSVTTYDHNGYAVYSHGELRMWGRNISGQNGKTASTTPDKTALLVANAGDVVEATGGGNHTLVLRRDGTVGAWGRYKHGQLGDGRTTIAPDIETPWADAVPNDVVGTNGTGTLSGVVAIAAGLEHSLALMEDGTVMGWGKGWRGQLGTGNGSSSGVPRPVVGIPPAVAITAGAYHSLVVDENGELWCFGWNSQGQCGNNATSNDVQTPVHVLGPGGTGFLTGVVAASAGWQHSMALLDDGSVWCFGDNGNGQCGIGTKDSPKLTPVQVKGIGGTGTLAASRIEAGFFFNTATTTTGTLVGWGGNYHGQLAVPGIAASMGGIADRATVEAMKTSTNTSITNVTTWAAGADHVVVLRATGSTLAWGENTDGECGDGTTTTSSVPAGILGL